MNNRILAQHDGNDADPRYFYMHDRLGSVRQVINNSGSVVRYYTYKPFGEVIESSHGPHLSAVAYDIGTLAKAEATSNYFMFTGQYYDSEIDEYYHRARQYDPHIYRFTSRDPVRGQYREPMTLHRYLYCLNDPINRMDPMGEMSLQELTESTSIGARLLRSVVTSVVRYK